MIEEQDPCNVEERIAKATAQENGIIESGKLFKAVIFWKQGW